MSPSKMSRPPQPTHLPLSPLSSSSSLSLCVSTFWLSLLNLLPARCSVSSVLFICFLVGRRITKICFLVGCHYLDDVVKETSMFSLPFVSCLLCGGVF